MYEFGVPFSLSYKKLLHGMSPLVEKVSVRGPNQRIYDLGINSYIIVITALRKYYLYLVDGSL